MRFVLGLLIISSIAIPLMLPVPPRPVSTQQRKIDDWIARNKLNEFGDPPDTFYTGSSPLFDERTGITKDRYAYILERHPELKDDGPRTR